MAHPVGGMTLTDFLLARIAEDASAARGIPAGAWEDATSTTRRYDHVFRWSPERVLAECEAKRRIVGEHKHIAVVYDDGSGQGRGCVICDQDRDYGTLSGTAPGGWCPTVRHLALPYADHPDYDEEWRP